ncbi:MAG TPA: isoprenyl transferase [Nitrospinota bacterium]|nr:isoprenyl transferase [Nitrospinota bacterium]|tara:strand:+ start:17783 stop:18544 length:762 start_codon:yes stop_codon:yes gene_type:complete
MSFVDLTAHIELASVPKHLAIIMDGNGRWAQKRGLPRVEGHQAGVKTVDEVVSFLLQIGVPYLTLYSFSSENWKRPPDEVSALMAILKQYLQSDLDKMLENDIRFNVIGRLDDLPGYIHDVVLTAMDKTKNNEKMTLTLALSYGARDEMVRAFKGMSEDVKNGKLDPEKVDEALISGYLDTSNIPDPDLLIRTSGELRISNFMLWQIAYTELFFTDKLWPEFGASDVADVIRSFQMRERRFGMTTSQLTKRGK